jgi:hypothetical protein
VSDGRADATAGGTAEGAPARPLLTVVRGEPTPEQLAALIAVVAARSGGEQEPEPPRPRWGRPAAAMRRPLAPGPGAWRASALPQ